MFPVFIGAFIVLALCVVARRMLEHTKYFSAYLDERNERLLNEKEALRRELRALPPEEALGAVAMGLQEQAEQVGVVCIIATRLPLVEVCAGERVLHVRWHNLPEPPERTGGYWSLWCNTWSQGHGNAVDAPMPVQVFRNLDKLMAATYAELGAWALADPFAVENTRDTASR